MDYGNHNSQLKESKGPAGAAGEGEQTEGGEDGRQIYLHDAKECVMIASLTILHS